ncbi:MAG TPA: PQQ-dependent dehydrogenase, methanol/ethanol family, partial [Burkholderiaceae bacterium]
MHGGMRFLIVGAAAAAVAGTALANSDLAKLEANPDNWAAQSGDFALTRHSKLTQINKGNVHKLQVAWTFSTGVLRGHEGG